MRLIVTGGRNYADRAHVWQVLNRIHAEAPITMLVHGAAAGADRLAAEWAVARGVPQEPHPADWRRFGKGAGPQRNRAMLNSGADAFVAFPGGRGTANMVAVAEDRGDQAHRGSDRVWSAPIKGPGACPVNHRATARAVIGVGPASIAIATSIAITAAIPAIAISAVDVRDADATGPVVADAAHDGVGGRGCEKDQGCEKVFHRSSPRADVIIAGTAIRLDHQTESVAAPDRAS